ncbi:YdcF family protein [Marinomonas sp. C1424]|uniref:YdcF family protein n=1 Tax=Marinomonas transparens TaxID=2795388 RepID=A0A934N1M6_9GAMM|nr:YdcF family protein [Marinomonas transparens]
MILFYIKKIVGTMLMPIPLTLMAMLLALFLIKKRPKTAKFFLFCAILLLGLTSWNPVADRLIATVEHDYPIFDITQPVDVVVVLGSGHKVLSNTPAVMTLSRSALFRLEEGLRILRANPDAMLFVSGYGGGNIKSHAEVMREAAIELGVSPTRIKTFPLAKDTEDEANMMEADLRGKRITLVTEASHLKRAFTFFERANINAIPAPALYLGSKQSDWRISANASYNSQRAFYEWLGRAWQWIKG